jgi:A/G-specific adenine glycosylase
VALKQEQVDLLPIKSKRLVRRDRFFLYLVAEYKSGIYIRKRTGKDIWQQLFEFIGQEVDEKEGEDVRTQLKKQWFTEIFGKGDVTVLGVSPVYRQLLTHQQVKARFVRLRLDGPLSNGDYLWVDRKELSAYPFPRLLNDYLNAPLQAPQLF